MTVSAFNVFLSYPHSSEKARSLVAEARSLLQREGYDPWLDSDKIVPGQDWDRWIRHSLHQADFVVVFWAAEAQNSASYIYKEIAVALEIQDRRHPGAGDVFVIPISIDGSAMPRSLEKRGPIQASQLPELIATLNSLRASRPPRTTQVRWTEYHRALRDSNAFRQLGTAGKVELRVTDDIASPDRFKIKVGEALQRHRRIVVLGEPGSGKSWLLMQTAARIGAAGSPIVYVRLRDWLGAGQGSADDERFYGLIWESLIAYQPNLSAAGPAKAKLFLQGEFEQSTASPLIALDGLDEVGDADRQADCLRCLAAFLAGCSGEVRIIATARRLGFLPDQQRLLEKNKFKVLEICRPDRNEKIAILRACLKQSAGDAHSKESADDVYRKFSKDFQTAKLYDNPLLLSIMAKLLMKGASFSNTRGALLWNHVKAAIDETFPDQPSRTMAVECLSDFAEKLHETRNPGLINSTEAVPAIAARISTHRPVPPDGDWSFHNQLHATRLLERRPGVEWQTSFALPQYQEVFLAYTIWLELRRVLGNVEFEQKVREMKAVTDSALHHALILAVGLLDEAEANSVVNALDDELYLLLKARMVGEANAPAAERAFISRVSTRATSGVDQLLRSLSRKMLAAIAIWAAGLLPVAFALLKIDVGSPYLGGAVAAAYGLGALFLLRSVYAAIFIREARTFKDRPFKRMLAALACVRTGDAERHIRKLRSAVLERRPPSADEHDLYASFIDAVARQCDRMLDEIERGLDATLHEFATRPEVLDSFLLTPARVLSREDLEILRGIAVSEVFLPADAIRCLDKLREVWRQKRRFRDVTRDTVEAIRKGATSTAVQRRAAEIQREFADEARTPGRGRESAAMAVATLLVLVLGWLLLG